MDIVENSIAAGARNVLVRIREDSCDNVFELEIEDDGKGMDEEFIKKAADPFTTTKSRKKVGLGLSFLKEAAEAANGSFFIQSGKDKGTIVKARFQRDHPDRKPIGNMEETLVCLMATNPDINIVYGHTRDGISCCINNGELMKKAGESIHDLPKWIRFLRENIHQSFDRLNFNSAR